MAPGKYQHQDNSLKIAFYYGWSFFVLGFFGISFLQITIINHENVGVSFSLWNYGKAVFFAGCITWVWLMVWFYYWISRVFDPVLFYKKVFKFPGINWLYHDFQSKHPLFHVGYGGFTAHFDPPIEIRFSKFWVRIHIIIIAIPLVVFSWAYLMWFSYWSKSWGSTTFFIVTIGLLSIAMFYTVRIFKDRTVQLKFTYQGLQLLDHYYSWDQIETYNIKRRMPGPYRYKSDFIYLSLTIKLSDEPIEMLITDLDHNVYEIDKIMDYFMTKK